MTSSVPLLSIDPSSRFVGWALLGEAAKYLASGVAIVPIDTPNERVLHAGRTIQVLVQSLPIRPSLVLIEIPNFVAERARPHIEVYFRAVGAIQMAIASMGLPLAYVDASAARDRGRKLRHRDIFSRITGKLPATDDEADAVALGVEWLNANSNFDLSEPDGYPE